MMEGRGVRPTTFVIFRAGHAQEGVWWNMDKGWRLLASDVTWLFVTHSRMIRTDEYILDDRRIGIDAFHTIFTTRTPHSLSMLLP